MRCNIAQCNSSPITLLNINNHTMKSSLSITIDSTAAEPKTTRAAGVAAAVSEGTAKVDFERQAHHFRAAKAAAKAAPKAAPKKKHQAEPSASSPPQVFDLINSGLGLPTQYYSPYPPLAYGPPTPHHPLYPPHGYRIQSASSSPRPHTSTMRRRLPSNFQSPSPPSSCEANNTGTIAIKANKHGMIVIEANNTGMITIEANKRGMIEIESNNMGMVMMDEDIAIAGIDTGTKHRSSMGKRPRRLSSSEAASMVTMTPPTVAGTNGRVVVTTTTTTSNTAKRSKKNGGAITPSPPATVVTTTAVAPQVPPPPASYREREVALVEQQMQKNRKFFVNHYAVKFEPKEEENNTIVEVIQESHPEAIAKASASNITISLNIAPAEHDHNFRRVGGKLPVTEEVRQAFTTGHAICTVTTLDNYYNGINQANYHTRRTVSRHLPPNLAGGIHKWGLVPLQSILKSSEQENVWMGGVHSLDWMVGHVIKDHPELLQGNNKLVCIVIPSGDPRLDLFHQFGAPGLYTGYVKPVISPFIVPVFAKDTVEFPANWIPHFLANAPHHPTVVQLLTEEQKRERARVYQQSYKRLYRSIEANRERERAYQRSYDQEHGCFIVECEKQKQHDCLGMCISHCTDWCTEFEKFFY